MPEFARQLAVDRPLQVAIRDQRIELGWAAVGDTLDRVANRLLAPDMSAELGDERRVAVFAENSVETALAHLGGLLGSTSTVPVLPALAIDWPRLTLSPRFTSNWSLCAYAETQLPSCRTRMRLP